MSPRSECGNEQCGDRVDELAHLEVELEALRSRVNEAERERDHWASETRTRGVEREAAIRALETRDAEVARLRELLDAIGQLRPGTKWGLGRALELARAAATPEATTPAVPGRLAEACPTCGSLMFCRCAGRREPEEKP